MADEQTNAENIEVFQGRADAEEEDTEKWYWHAKAGNGEIVANSAPESYTRREDAVRAVEDTFPGVPVSVKTVINEDEELADVEGEVAEVEDDAT